MPINVTVREKDPGSGIWWIYTNKDGDRKARKFGPDKKAADKVAKQIEAKLILGKWATPDEIEKAKQEAESKVATVREYYEGTFKAVLDSKRYSPSTADTYKISFSEHILPALGDVPLNQLESKIEKFFVDLSNKAPKQHPHHKTKPDASKTLSKCTCQSVHKHLKSFLNHAKDAGLITTNPATLK